MPGTEPFLSVVVTSRNDNYGGNLVRRAQAFVNGFVGHCSRHGLNAELIVVEWNPPPDRPRLVDALPWPDNTDPCSIRIISVPGSLHRRYKRSHHVSLFPKIALNVGIHRANGRFILATTVDVLFADELMEFLAAGSLQVDRLYRIDRHDVLADVPDGASVEQQVAFCQNHQGRLHTRDATYALARDGRPILEVGGPMHKPEPDDIVDDSVGLDFGSGWYAPESGIGTRYRWAHEDCSLYLKAGAASTAVLTLDIEPGPGMAGRPFALRVKDSGDNTVASEWVDGNRPVCLSLPVFAHAPNSFRFHVGGGGLPAARDERRLDFRVFRPIRLEGKPGPQPSPIVGRANRVASRWLRRVRARLGRWVEHPPQGLPHRQLTRREFGPQRPFVLEQHPAGVLPLYLHACSDFILMAREHWLALRGYPELAISPRQLDSLFCHQACLAGIREEVLPEPMRIYHLEHDEGWERPPAPCGQPDSIPTVARRHIEALVCQVRSGFTPTLFNKRNWGLVDEPLAEVCIGSQSRRRLAVG